MDFLRFPLTWYQEEQLEIIGSHISRSHGIFQLDEKENTKCFDILEVLKNRRVLKDAEINNCNAYQVIGDFEEFSSWIREENERSAVEEKRMDSNSNQQKEKKILISHSSKDKEYVAAFVELLASIGIKENKIICSSVPPYCIPLNNNVYDWLVNEFQQSDLHVFFALSEAYYDSAPCLNEMGAAWAMKHVWTTVLLPGFGFTDIRGCIDNAQIGIKLDDDDRETLLFRLDELKDSLISEFEIEPISSFAWEKRRNEFLEKIDGLIGSEREESAEEVKTKKMVSFERDESILLIYAAEDPNGHVECVNSITRMGSTIVTNGWEFNSADTPRESARWQAAVKKLEKYNLVEATNYKKEFYAVTDQGYRVAEEMKTKLGIEDTDKDPHEYLN